MRLVLSQSSWYLRCKRKMPEMKHSGLVLDNSKFITFLQQQSFVRATRLLQLSIKAEHSFICDIFPIFQ